MLIGDSAPGVERTNSILVDKTYKKRYGQRAKNKQELFLGEYVGLVKNSGLGSLLRVFHDDEEERQQRMEQNETYFAQLPQSIVLRVQRIFTVALNNNIATIN